MLPKVYRVAHEHSIECIAPGVKNRSPWCRELCDQNRSSFEGCSAKGNRPDSGTAGPVVEVSDSLCGLAIGLSAGVRAFGKQFEHLPIEHRRDVVGIATRNDSVTHNNFFVDPCAAGILNVCF